MTGTLQHGPLPSVGEQAQLANATDHRSLVATLRLFSDTKRAGTPRPARSALQLERHRRLDHPRLDSNSGLPDAVQSGASNPSDPIQTRLARQHRLLERTVDADPQAPLVNVALDLEAVHGIRLRSSWVI